MAVGKFRFWWEGRKAAHRDWSRKRVVASERARLESEIAGLKRKQLRNERKSLRRTKRERAKAAAWAKASGLKRRSRWRATDLAARALPKSVAIQAASNAWVEVAEMMPDRNPRSITFHEALLKLSQK